ncbi:MAG: MFS transporter, partial [Pseudomonadota bacterium]|nr:MFS transporter [Pseudomonadota bacterium]
AAAAAAEAAPAETGATPAPPAEVSALAVTAILAASTAVTLNMAITNTSLPTIAADLGAGQAESVWVVTAFQFALAATILPLGALGDSIGHRKVFLWGLALFVATSLLSGLAWSLPALAGARALQGVGGAALSAATPALIRAVYPPERLGRGLGFYALAVGVGLTAGPTVASAVLAVADWPWLFLLNVPVGGAALALALAAMPKDTPARRPLDPVSALLCMAFFVLVLLGLSEAAHDARPLRLLALLGGGALCGWTLTRRERGRPSPIFAADLFRIRMFALSSATSVCAFTVQGAAFVALPFLLQEVLGRSQVETGLLLTPWPAATAVMAVAAARMADRDHAGILGALGLVMVGAGMALMAALPPGASDFDLGWRLVLCGMGFGLFQTPNMRAIMASAPASRSGGAGGILATSRLMGQSIGATLCAFCLTLGVVEGSVAALWLGGAVAGLGCVVSLARLAGGGGAEVRP